MLAHKAEEGCGCSEILAGQTGHIDYDNPALSTLTEVATAGKTEEQLKTLELIIMLANFLFLLILVHAVMPMQMDL